VRDSVVFDLEKEPGDALDGGRFFWSQLGARAAAIRAVTFTPHFGAFDADHLITISAAGAVKADPNPPKKLDNFVMVIKAESNPPAPAPSETFTLLQRFHLHDDFKPGTIQLTPAGLTVGVGGEDPRYRVTEKTTRQPVTTVTPDAVSKLEAMVILAEHLTTNPANRGRYQVSRVDPAVAG
jgi:hypothetical protein